jgi:hypothetical protein
MPAVDLEVTAQSLREYCGLGLCPICLAGSPSSASYTPAQFRMEFTSNRSDDACGIILGKATDKKHLISQR